MSSRWYNQFLQNGGTQPPEDVKAKAKSLLLELDKDNIVYKLGFIDHINHTKEMSYIATSPNEGLSLFHKKFPELPNIKIGTVLKVAFPKFGR